MTPSKLPARGRPLARSLGELLLILLCLALLGTVG